MAEVSSKVLYNADPALGLKVVVLTFTKLAQNDTINCFTYGGIANVLFVKAQNDAAGANDPVTISSNTITLTSADTGAGRALVIGTS